MSILIAMLIAGTACAVTQALSETKLPMPLVGIIMIVVGGILTKAGVFTKLNELAPGGCNVTAVGCGNGAYAAGQALATGGGPMTLIISAISILFVVLLGIFCSGILLKKFPDAFEGPDK